MDEYLGDSKVDDEIHEMKKSIVTAGKGYMHILFEQ